MSIGGIGIGSALAIYFILWWLSLFMVLPFGVRSQEEDGTVTKGTEPGAPVRAAIGRKMLVTTVLSAVFFAIFLAIMNSGLTLDMLPGPKTHATG